MDLDGNDMMMEMHILANYIQMDSEVDMMDDVS